MFNWFETQVHCFTRWGITLATGCRTIVIGCVSCASVVGTPVVIYILVLLQIIQIMENLRTYTALVPFHWNTILPNDNWLPVGKNGEVKGFILNCLGFWGVVIANILINRFWRIMLSGLLLWNPYFINLDAMNAKMLKKMELDADIE